MGSKENKKNYRYGDGHSRFYKPSVISPLLCSNTQDDKGNVVHTTIFNDVNLLLRQKDVSKSVGIDALRNYVESLMVERKESHNFTDDELFQLIEPKSINTLTDAYQYAKYIEAHSKEIKDKYDNIVKHKKAYDDYMNLRLEEK